MFSQRILCRSWQKYCTHSEYKISILHHSKLVQNTARYIKNSRIKLNVESQSKGITPAPAAPFSNVPNSSGNVLPSQIGKAFLFSCTFSVGCFFGVTVWEYENVRKKLIARSNYAQTWLNGKLERKSPNLYTNLQKEISKYWNKLSPGEKVFAPICALNLIVFGLWRIPRLQSTMVTYFCSNPAGRAICWPMFLSTFSHYSFFHIFANMYVLHSFSSAAILSMGKEQFLGLYLSAGVVSSLTSYFLKAVTSQAGLSLGASGAIMAILAYVCCQFPDTQLGILFLPMFTFSAGAAIKVIMGIDLAGCLLGWKFFDHAAHLGGSLFGIFWALVGKDYLWPKREQFLRVYHDIRSSK